MTFLHAVRYLWRCHYESLSIKFHKETPYREERHDLYELRRRHTGSV